jgi:thioredoxin
VEPQESEARRAVREARERAAREGKRVAVIFGAGWCGDSSALEAALEHRLVAPIVDPAFVVVRVDVGNRDRNLDLMADYGMAVERGIPTVAVLEPDGRLVAAQRDGELADAGSLGPVEIATMFHRWSRAAAPAALSE